MDSTRHSAAAWKSPYTTPQTTAGFCSKFRRQILRLVHHHDWPRVLDELNRPAPVHPIFRVLDDGAAFVERLNVHHHQLHVIASGKLPELRYLRGVVHLIIQWCVAVERLEMFLRQFNRVHHRRAERGDSRRRVEHD